MSLELKEDQKQLLKNNLVPLIENASLFSHFVTKLSAHRHLSSKEKDALKNKHLEKYDQVYDILSSRFGTYDVLIQTLEDNGHHEQAKHFREHANLFGQVGNIYYDKNKVLGNGIFGTSTYKGIYKGRGVAVRVYPNTKTASAVARNEIDFLSKLDYHENIVRYFTAEFKKSCICIVLELCVISLEGEIQINLLKTPRTTVLEKCTKGVVYLHENNIIHGNLKAANILLSYNGQVKISNFYESKRIPVGSDCIQVQDPTMLTSVTWKPPEIYNCLKHVNTKQDIPEVTMGTFTDIFSLGCVYLFTLVDGFHPLGTGCFEIQHSFLTKQSQSDNENTSIETNWLGLINEMIATDLKRRPPGKNIFLTKCFQIKKLIPELVECTNATSFLLSYLGSKAILYGREIEDLREVGHKQGNKEKGYLMYDIVFTRRRGYDVIIDALLRDNQSKPAQILKMRRKEFMISEAKIRSKESVDDHVHDEQRDARELRQELEGTEIGKDGGSDYCESVFTGHAKVLYDEIASSDAQLFVVSSLDVRLTVDKFRNILPIAEHSIVHNNNELFSLWQQPQLDSLEMKKFVCTYKNANNNLSFYILYDDMHNQDQNVEDCLSLLRSLRIGKDEKVVIVTSNMINALEMKYFYSDPNSMQVVLLQDSFRWEYINKKTQEKILKLEVVDQGKLVGLNKVCKSYVYENEEHFKRSFLKDKLLVDLLNYDNAPPIIFRQTIPPVKGNYISRRIRSRNVISKEIFKSVYDNEVFVFSGLKNLEKLKQMVGSCCGHVDTAGNQIRENIVTAHFILLEFEFDFGDFCHLCARSNISVHRINVDLDNECLSWVGPRGGSMKLLHQHICKPEEQHEYMEEDLVAIMKRRPTTQPIIICDSPGMGKTILLASLANQVRDHVEGGSIVLFFVMTDFITGVRAKLTKICSEEDDKSHLDDILKTEILSNASCYNIQDVSFLRSAAHLFFDGLDEVAQNTISFAFECLHRLQKLVVGARFYIATRRNLLHRAEQSFETLGYTIEKFNFSDQVNFLSKYWSNQNMGYDIDTDKLKKFTKCCLSKLNELNETKKESDFAGVPLQCLLIGEVFEMEALRYANPENIHLAKEAKLTIAIKSITDLYQRMITRKLLSFAARYLLPENRALKEDCLKAVHLYLSIQVIFAGSQWPEKMRSKMLTKKVFTDLKEIFPDWTATFQEFELGELPREEILLAGIVEAVEEGKLQFIHRTFAEYFVGEFACKNIQGHEIDQNISNFIEEAVLETIPAIIHPTQTMPASIESYTFKLPVICHFINYLLPLRFWSSPKSNGVVLENRNHARILQACIINDYDKLVQLYFVHFQRDNQAAKTMLALAAWFCSPKIFDLFGYTEDLFQNYQLSLLHIVAERGSYAMTTHLYMRHFLESIKDWNHEKLRSLLHACVNQTNKLDISMISERREILNLFEKYNPGFIIKCLHNNQSSLLENSIHVQLLISILSHVSNQSTDNILDEVDDEEKTWLHVPAKYLTADEYVQFLYALLHRNDNTLQQLSVCMDENGQIPFHFVIRQMEPRTEILNIFSNLRPNINIIDTMGYNIIWTAIRSHRSSTCMEYLLNLANSNVARTKKDAFYRCSLHIAAQYAKDTNILEIFIKSGLDVNSVDSYGNTPAFYAMRNVNSNHVLRHLLSRDGDKADLDHYNKKGETLLHWAAELGKLKTVQLLFQLGYSLGNQPDKQGNTPLHWALRSSNGERLSTVKYLLTKFYEDVDRKNKKSQCPLMYALTKSHPDVTPEVIEYFKARANCTPTLTKQIREYTSSKKCSKYPHSNLEA